MESHEIRSLWRQVARRHLEESQARAAVATVPEGRGKVLTLPTAEAGAFCEAMRQLEEMNREFDGYFQAGHIARLRVTKPRGTPRRERPCCGAQTRSGAPCKARVVERPNGTLSKRCRMHGGTSTGPRSEAGREAIRASNKRRARKREEEEDATST